MHKMPPLLLWKRARNGQSPAITPEATYIPVPKRSCSRFALYHKQRICNCRIGVIDTKVVIDG
ncbi:alpha-galactosidase [Lacticaseibacillus paracasei]|uniref:Alpha-galactosidase n=1 Tax=Lacticaseibacillus paracasei TaxID=1597 RepID=A0ABD7BVU3_LACPA|nr:alpha-galactosidase [Lacticaseibacillus paracasei]